MVVMPISTPPAIGSIAIEASIPWSTWDRDKIRQRQDVAVWHADNPVCGQHEQQLLLPLLLCKNLQRQKLGCKKLAKTSPATATANV